MKRMLNKLTPKFVAKAMTGQGANGRFSDGGHLFLVVKGGACSWVFLHLVEGKQRQIAIGSAYKLADGSGVTDPLKRANHSLTEARNKAAEMRLKLVRGEPLTGVKQEREAAKLTWDVIHEYYLQTKRIDSKKVAKYVEPWKNIIGTSTSAAFDRNKAITYRETLLETIQPNTVRSYVKMMSAIYQHYINEKQANFKNPFNKLGVDKSEETITLRKPMPIDLIKSVRDMLDGDDLIIWDLLATTGARVGEIVGIKSTDISNGFISIDSNEKRSIKNTSSRRIIPVFIQLPERKEEFYFADTVNAVTWRFANRIRKLTTDRKITTHSLRHAVTDVLREAGIDPIYEDFFLGHHSKTVASKDYGSIESRSRILKERIEPVMAEFYKRILAVKSSDE